MKTRFSAIVLAGGRSERMGRAKADLPFGTETMLARIVRELAREFADIVIVAASAPQPPDFAAATIIRDESAYPGPVDALARGLGAAANPIAFACSCDLPLLEAALARRICEMLADADDDALIPRVDGRYQPLHAGWRTRSAGVLARMHQNGERRLTDAFPKLRVRVLEEPELRALTPSLASFLNVNTSEDYENALALAKLK